MLQQPLTGRRMQIGRTCSPCDVIAERESLRAEHGVGCARFAAVVNTHISKVVMKTGREAGVEIGAKGLTA
jgi:hypothetical protein